MSGADRSRRGIQVHGLLAPAFGMLMLGLAACSEGCVHELPVTVPSRDVAVSVEQLEDLLWPATEDRWRPAPERELVAIEKLVSVLLGRAEAGYLGAAQAGRVQRLLIEAGLELRVVQLGLDPEGHGASETLWVLTEPADDRRGRGSYVFRLGDLAEFAPRDRGRGRVEHLLEAPHSRFDKYTGKLGVRLFVERDIGVQPARALFVNSSHRYRQLDGTRTRQAQPEQNPADAAHQPNHPFARATALALRKHPLAVVQLHGFERDLTIGDPDVIVSSGQTRPSKTSQATLRRLRAAFPNLAMAHYGVDIERLGGETNVQGKAARTERRCFVHIETSGALRKLLRREREARRRFAAAVFGADGEELRGGCR